MHLLSPLLILSIALGIVIAGVLVLRLHAFLSLIVAALVVAALTPGAAIQRYELRRDAVRIAAPADRGAAAVVIDRRHQLTAGADYEVYRLIDGQPPLRVGRVRVASSDQIDAPAANAAAPSTRLVMGEPEGDRVLATGDWVIAPAAASAAFAMSRETIGERVAAGFGRTILDIGILIAMASILGGCLMAARGAERIVVSLRRAVGTERTPLAFLASGLLLGIPMFAEAVFYLLLPLAKAMWLESRRHYVLLVLAIVAGATMTHSLVPPTPGPLFVADAMGISIALMMRQGAIVAIVAALAGYTYARYADRRWGIPMPMAGAALTHDDVGPTSPAAGPLPPLVWSLLPILLPVVLISADAALSSSTYGLPGWLIQTIQVLGDRNLALSLSAGAALLLLAWQALPDKSGSYVVGKADTSGSYVAGANRGERIRRAVRDSIVEAGEIILVIGAGGALGAVLRQAGMSELAAATVPEQKLLLLPIAWGITAVVRMAQGSATVAMITAVGIVGPIALADQLPYHPVYVAVAIGCGSKIGMWMNDSGFWVIARMSGMSEIETLRTASAMVFIEGCVGLVATLVLAAVWPLV